MKPFRVLLSSALLLLVVGQALPQDGGETATGVAFHSEGSLIKGRFFPGKSSGQLTTVLLLSGFPGNTQDMLGLGEKLSGAGMNVLTFNYAGTHESEGKFTLDHALKDIAAAYRFLSQEANIRRFRVDTGRIVLGGYSFGGGMAMTYAAGHPGIRRVFSVAGTDHGEFAREYSRNREFAVDIDSIFGRLTAPRGPVRFDGQWAVIELVENPDPYDLRLAAPRLAGRDILLIGGWDDDRVTVEHHILPFYRVLRGAGAERIRMVALQDDHSFRAVRAELAEVVTGWILSGGP